MHEKFFKLSKGLRWAIIVLTWALTIAGFVGCLMVKQYADLPWLEIILTMVGMLLSVVAICVTIMQLTENSNDFKEENE